MSSIPSTRPPANHQTFHTYTPAETEAALSRSEAAFKSFCKTSTYNRADLLRKLVQALRSNKDSLAETITTEVGKIFAEAQVEVEKCALEAEWYAENGPKMLADEPAPTGGTEAYISFHSLGSILGIMPWNLPLWQATRFCIPMLLAAHQALPQHAKKFTRIGTDLSRSRLSRKHLPKSHPAHREHRQRH